MFGWGSFLGVVATTLKKNVRSYKYIREREFSAQLNEEGHLMSESSS